MFEKSNLLLLLSLLLLIATTVGVGYLYYQNHRDTLQSDVALLDSSTYEVSDTLRVDDACYLPLS